MSDVNFFVFSFVFFFYHHFDICLYNNIINLNKNPTSLFDSLHNFFFHFTFSFFHYLFQFSFPFFYCCWNNFLVKSFFLPIYFCERKICFFSYYENHWLNSYLISVCSSVDDCAVTTSISTVHCIQILKFYLKC